MELRHLRYFVALAHTHNFTRAAELVHVAQSTLSHQIQQLEEELGVPLFLRQARSVELTPEGERFLEQARTALQALDAGVRSLQPGAPGAERRLRIGATPSLLVSLVAPAVAATLAGQPGLSASLLELAPNQVREALLAKDIDMALAYPPLDTEGIVAEGLYTEEMKLFVSPAHPLAQRRRVRLAELHGQLLVLPGPRFSIRAAIDGFFREAGAEPVVVAEADSFPATLGLILALNAAAVMPGGLGEGAGVRAIPIERPFAQRRITLYRRKGDPFKADLKRLHLEILRAARQGAKP